MVRGIMGERWYQWCEVSWVRGVAVDGVVGRMGAHEGCRSSE